jgi:Na+/H+ antiporter NhaD/arsenite permease-like protein
MLSTAHPPSAPPLFLLAPFCLLLVLIAAGPTMFAGWWHRHFRKVALSLGTVTLGWQLLVANAGGEVAHTAHEYAGFICLVGSLYVVSGGVSIELALPGVPLVNVAFLFAGGLLSNLVGTTGAAMLLIRPWLLMNRPRLARHHVVFFIFVVANAGGCLTPIGDPPLFLGYLKGLPFWWFARHCWPMWMVCNGLLLGVFAWLDHRHLRRAAPKIAAGALGSGATKVAGAHNLLFLGVIVGATLFLRSPPFAREAVMLGAAGLSWLTTNPSVRTANGFDWAPLNEVAVLFAGIFSTMMPALDWLGSFASSLEHPSPGVFYFAAGVLSSVLDNAPTFASFLAVILGLHAGPGEAAEFTRWLAAGSPAVWQFVDATQSAAFQAARDILASEFGSRALVGANVSPKDVDAALLLASPAATVLLAAISTAAVFFGAATYIGNGPNFMVKAMAERMGAPTPGFAGYIGRFTLPILVPVLVIVGWLFFV